MNRAIIIPLIAICLCVNVAAQAQNSGGTLTFAAKGFRNSKGTLLCYLYNSPKDFPKKTQNAIKWTKSRIINKRATCQFSQIKPGQYAVTLMHDENGNGRMDSNFLGIPKEGVGLSRNPKVGIGNRPTFKKAAFQFNGTTRKETINMFYP